MFYFNLNFSFFANHSPSFVIIPFWPFFVGHFWMLLNCANSQDAFSLPKMIHQKSEIVHPFSKLLPSFFLDMVPFFINLLKHLLFFSGFPFLLIFLPTSISNWPQNDDCWSIEHFQPNISFTFIGPISFILVATISILFATFWTLRSGNAVKYWK